MIHERLFLALEFGDVRRVIDLLYPSVRDQIDPPVMAAWMEEVQSRLGKFRAAVPRGHSTVVVDEFGSELVRSCAVAKFERVKRSPKLSPLAGRLRGYSSHRIALTIGTYCASTRKSIAREPKSSCASIFGGDGPCAYDMMHPNLQRNLPWQEFAKIVADAKQAGGLESSISPVGQGNRMFEGVLA